MIQLSGDIQDNALHRPLLERSQILFAREQNYEQKVGKQIDKHYITFYHFQDF